MMSLNEIENKLNGYINNAWLGKMVSSKEFFTTWEKIKIVKNIPIYNQEKTENDKELVYMWAPAGNQSTNAKIVFSGFSTSINAAKQIAKNINKEARKLGSSSEDFSPRLREICAMSIYKGAMLVRLAWGIKKLAPLFSKKLSFPIYDIIRAEWSNLEILSEKIDNSTKNGTKIGEGNLFCGNLNCQTVLTQSTFNGLAIKKNDNYSCAASKIPINIAKQMSKNYIFNYLDCKVINKPKVIFILGNKAADCWNYCIQELRKDKKLDQNVQVLTDNWWNKKTSFFNNASQYILKLPHPSPGNVSYIDKVNEIASYLEKKV